MKRLLAAMAFAFVLVPGFANQASAQDMYLGEIRLFGFNFCPVGWTPANGQILPIAQNSALFSLYGTVYGGNGTTTFALPNLTGRAPYGAGTTPGLPPTVIGQLYGNSTVTLATANLPAHTHQLNGSSAADTVSSPAGALLATFSGGNIYAAAGSPPNSPMSTTAIGNTGGNQPVNTQSPALALTWCVATVGIYPSRP